MAKRRYLSIIIPTYNSARTLPALLDSIFASDFSDFEVILVDDGSTDETKSVIEDYDLKYYYIDNSGPARARHLGTKKAKGEILVFFDSDVVLLPDTLKRIKDAFADEKIKAVTGIWDKKQKRKDFFPRYKALRDWSYWLKEDYGRFSYLFSTRVAAVRKEAYWQVGGFVREEKGRNALEDINFAFRLAEECRIYFDPKIRVKHEFGNFWEILGKYFKRSFKWVKLFLRHRQLNRTVVTPNEAIAGVTAVFTLVFLFLGGFWRPLWLIALTFFLVHLYLERKFLTFIFKEEGLVFAIKSILAGFIIYPVIYAGAGLSFLHSGWLALRRRVSIL